MSQVSLTEYLASIANAIRAKTGKTEKINAQNFATEILNMVISGGNGDNNNTIGGGNLVTTPAYFYGYTSPKYQNNDTTNNNNDNQFTIYGKGSILIYLCSEDKSSNNNSVIISELGQNVSGENESCYIVEQLPETAKSILDDGVMEYYVIINDSDEQSLPDIYLNLQNVQSGKPTWITLSQLIQMMSEDSNAQQVEYNMGYVDSKDDPSILDQLSPGKYFFVRKDYTLDLYFKWMQDSSNYKDYYTKDFFKDVFNLEYNEIEISIISKLPDTNDGLTYDSSKLCLYVSKKENNVYILLEQGEQPTLLSLQEWIYNRVSSTIVNYNGVIHSENDAKDYESKHIDFYTIIKNKKILTIEDEYDEYKVFKQYSDSEDNAQLVELIEVTSAIDHVKLQKDKVIKSNGTYTPDEGFDGISQVIVQIDRVMIEVATPEEMSRILLNATINDVGNVYKYLGQDTEDFKCGAIYEIYQEAEILSIRATDYTTQPNENGVGDVLIINSDDYDIQIQ